MNKSTKSLINRKTAGYSSLITFAVLLLAWISGFSSRLFAVIRFESIIHEFDPWYVFITCTLRYVLFNIIIYLGSIIELRLTWYNMAFMTF